MDSSFDYENLKILIGLPDTKHSPVVCLHDCKLRYDYYIPINFFAKLTTSRQQISELLF